MYRTAIQDGAFLDANDSMARLLGYDSVDELLKHRSVDHFLNPADRDGLVASAAERYGSAPHVYNLEMTTVDGSLVVIQFHEIAVTEKGYYEGACIDVTAQVLSERRELSTRLLYQTTLDAIMDGVIAYDLRSDVPVVCYQNRRAVDLLGAIGMDPPRVNEACRSCSGASCSTIVCNAVHLAAKDEIPVTNLLKTARRPSGDAAIYAVMALPVRGSGCAGATHVVCILRDLSLHMSGTATLEQELLTIQGTYENAVAAAKGAIDATHALSDNLTEAFARLQNMHSQAIIRNAELETVLSTLPDALFMVDLDARAAVAYGTSSGKISGTSVSRLSVVYGNEAESLVLAAADRAVSEQRNGLLHLDVEAAAYQVRVMLLPQQHRRVLVMFRDVTERRVYEKLLLSIAGLVDALCDDTAMSLDGLTRLLGSVGEVMHVDRVYVMTNRMDDGVPVAYTQIAEWCAPGVESQAGNAYLQDMPYSTSPADGVLHTFWQTMRSGDLFDSSRYALEGEYGARLTEQGITSLLIAPLLRGRTFIGFIGFDLCREAREWTKRDEVTLRAFAAVLAHSAWLERLMAGL